MKQIQNWLTEENQIVGYGYSCTSSKLIETIIAHDECDYLYVCVCVMCT